MKHPNKNIPIKSLIAEKEILFEYSIQIQISSNKSILANKNIILVPENNKMKKPNKNIITIEILKSQFINNAIEITTINQNNTNIINKKNNPINVNIPIALINIIAKFDILIIFINIIAKSRKFYNKYNFDKSFGSSIFIANKNPNLLIYYQIINLPDSFK